MRDFSHFSETNFINYVALINRLESSLIVITNKGGKLYLTHFMTK